MKRIEEMNRDELVFSAYSAYRNDMACLAESEEAAMHEAMKTSTEDLRAYLVDNADYVEEIIQYKGVSATMDGGRFLILWDDTEKWFDDMASLVEFIDREVR